MATWLAKAQTEARQAREAAAIRNGMSGAEQEAFRHQLDAVSTAVLDRNSYAYIQALNTLSKELADYREAPPRAPETGG